MGKQLVAACNEKLLLWWIWTTHSFMTGSSSDEHTLQHTVVLSRTLLPALNQSYSSFFIWWASYIEPSLPAHDINLPQPLRPVPHPKHAITSRPRRCAAQVIDDSLRWKQEVPAGSPLKIKDLSCQSLDTYTSTLLQIPPTVPVGMGPSCCICVTSFSPSFKSNWNVLFIQLVAEEASTYSWVLTHKRSSMLLAVVLFFFRCLVTLVQIGITCLCCPDLQLSCLRHSFNLLG